MATKKKSTKKASKKEASKRDQVLAFIKKSRRNNLTYGEVAEAVDSVPMAVGQILKSLGNDPETKALTKKVKNQKDIKKAS